LGPFSAAADRANSELAILPAGPGCLRPPAPRAGRVSGRRLSRQFGGKACLL